jgi:hypothetical protein
MNEQEIDTDRSERRRNQIRGMDGACTAPFSFSLSSARASLLVLSRIASSASGTDRRAPSVARPATSGGTASTRRRGTEAHCQCHLLRVAGRWCTVDALISKPYKKQRYSTKRLDDQGGAPSRPCSVDCTGFSCVVEYLPMNTPVTVRIGGTSTVPLPDGDARRSLQGGVAVTGVQRRSGLLAAPHHIAGVRLNKNRTSPLQEADGLVSQGKASLPPPVGLSLFLGHAKARRRLVMPFCRPPPLPVLVVPKQGALLSPPRNLGPEKKGVLLLH